MMGEQLISALLKAQSEFPEIWKDSEADAGRFKYTYASLPEIAKKIKPVLHANDLFISQTSFKGSLVTTLWHKSGECMVSEIEMPSPTSLSPQDWGKAHSYYRRYEINGMLGLTPDDDDDALGVETPKQAAKKEPPRHEPSVLERLLENDKELIKAWSPAVKTLADAEAAVVGLLEALRGEIDKGADLYEAARREMNSAVDRRAAG
jgi:hypothetical protein